MRINITIQYYKAEKYGLTFYIKNFPVGVHLAVTRLRKMTF